MQRPKILTALTVPTGGWDLDFEIEVASVMTPLTATIPAGTYFISWDARDDDLLYQVAKQITDAIAAGPGGIRYCDCTIDATGKVNIWFQGSGFNGATQNDVSLIWTTSNADLAAALGFDASADDDSVDVDSPDFTGDWQHAYGWYADDDGQLASLGVEDIALTETQQLIAYAGQSYCQQIGERWVNELSLQWLPRDLTFSRQVGYGTAPVHPYTRNKALECWWLDAQQGTRFRVYRDGRLDDVASVDRMELTAANTLSVTDGNKALTTNRHVGRLVLVKDSSAFAGNQRARFYILSHTATQLVADNACPNSVNWWYNTSDDDTALILDQRYETYVVDLTIMPTFAPREHPNADYYDITIPLIRYESPT